MGEWRAGPGRVGGWGVGQDETGWDGGPGGAGWGRLRVGWWAWWWGGGPGG